MTRLLPDADGVPGWDRSMVRVRMLPVTLAMTLRMRHSLERKIEKQGGPIFLNPRAC